MLGHGHGAIPIARLTWTVCSSAMGRHGRLAPSDHLSVRLALLGPGQLEHMPHPLRTHAAPVVREDQHLIPRACRVRHDID